MHKAINNTIEEDMIRQKEKFQREARAKLSKGNWLGGIKWLMKMGTATADDWGIVADNIGYHKAWKLATDLGFSVADEPETSHTPNYR